MRRVERRMGGGGRRRVGASGNGKEREGVAERVVSQVYRSARPGKAVGVGEDFGRLARPASRSGGVKILVSKPGQPAGQGG